MGDSIEDYMIWVIGAMLALWQLIDSIVIKANLLKKIIWSAAIIAFVWLGLDQITRARNEKKMNDKKFSALQEKVERLNNNIVVQDRRWLTDSTSNSEFQKELSKQFNIGRDPNNHPYSITNNTKIDKARDVYIGGR